MKLRSKILTLQYDSSMRNLVFVGIDWGTSSARAYGFDAQGTVLASANDSPEQAMGVQTLRQRLGRDPTSDDFAASLNALYLALLASLKQHRKQHVDGPRHPFSGERHDRQ
jgi:ribulose kinase